MTNGTPTPPWPDQGGNIIVINGGASQDRIQIAGDNPAIFPDFTVTATPPITLGGWTGPPPGPPAGTGLVTGAPPPPPTPTPPAPETGESENDYLLRCAAALTQQGVQQSEAETMCQDAWNAASGTRSGNPNGDENPNGRRRRKRS